MDDPPPSADAECPPDLAAILHGLRTAFPGWGFLYDPRTRTWTALRGDRRSGITLQRQDPVSLRSAIEETVRGGR